MVLLHGHEQHIYIPKRWLLWLYSLSADKASLHRLPGRLEKAVVVPGVAGREFTLWDDFPVEGRRDAQQEMTLEGLLIHMKTEYNLQVSGLYYGPAVLYSVTSEHKDRLRQSVSDVVRMVTKSEIPPHTRILEIYASFAEDEDCERVPPIRYLLQ
ncbi:unnamed protein product [Boreogadus saida]